MLLDYSSFDFISFHPLNFYFLIAEKFL